MTPAEDLPPPHTHTYIHTATDPGHCPRCLPSTTVSNPFSCGLMPSTRLHSSTYYRNLIAGATVLVQGSRTPLRGSTCSLLADEGRVALHTEDTRYTGPPSHGMKLHRRTPLENAIFLVAAGDASMREAHRYTHIARTVGASKLPGAYLGGLYPAGNTGKQTPPLLLPSVARGTRFATSWLPWR